MLGDRPGGRLHAQSGRPYGRPTCTEGYNRQCICFLDSGDWSSGRLIGRPHKEPVDRATVLATPS